MQTSNNKIKNLLGFVLKSNSIIFGLDNIKETRKKPTLIIACNTLSEKNLSKLSVLAEKKNITQINLQNITLEELLNINNVKTVAITNKSLSSEILKQAKAGKSHKIIKRGATVE